MLVPLQAKEMGSLAAVAQSVVPPCRLQRGNCCFRSSKKYARSGHVQSDAQRARLCLIEFLEQSTSHRCGVIDRLSVNLRVDDIR
jgi:hypothetical protein